MTSYLSHLTPLPSRTQLNVGKGIPIYGLLKVRLVSCFNPLAFTLIIANSIRIILKQYIFVTNILYLYTNTKLVFYPGAGDIFENYFFESWNWAFCEIFDRYFQIVNIFEIISSNVKSSTLISSKNIISLTYFKNLRNYLHDLKVTPLSYKDM